MSNKQYIMRNGKAVEVSEEIYEYLVKSDRHIRYVEEDLKTSVWLVKHILMKSLTMIITIRY